MISITAVYENNQYLKDIKKTNKTVDNNNS